MSPKWYPLTATKNSMGMFDYVIVEQPIEGVPNAESVEWQTKDFEAPFMDRYRISADGRLIEEVVHFEDQSDFARTGAGDRFAGCMTRVHDGWRDMNFHGELSFHGFAKGFPGALTVVTARFTNGVVENLYVEAVL